MNAPPVNLMKLEPLVIVIFHMNHMKNNAICVFYNEDEGLRN